MASFSERYGYAKSRDALQLECMDGNLRTSIYNVLYEKLYEKQYEFGDVCIHKRIWSKFWHKAIDEYSPFRSFYDYLKQWIKECPWNQAYDLIEFVANEFEESDEYGKYSDRIQGVVSYATSPYSELEDFRNDINEVLEREHAGYRLAGALVIPITNVSELDSIDQTLQTSDKFGTAREHLHRALELFSIRENPDYVNAVKESISAVEATAHTLLGDESATLGKALKTIQKNGNLHPALAMGWEKIYGFTSDAGGIRHAEHHEDIQVDGAFAKYMLVSCSAFVNYLIESNAESKSAQKY